MSSSTDEELREIRLVGRGGQGVVTAGDLLGLAAVREGRWAQSIPTFGPERRGALSTSTLRLAPTPIRLKCAAARPEVLLVLDPTIWHHANVCLAIREGATLVFNSPREPAEVEAELRGGAHGYRVSGRFTVATVDATGIALLHLGRPITNTAMMGAFAGATGLVTMSALAEVLGERFGSRAEANVAAAGAAREALRRAQPAAQPSPAIGG